MFGFLNERSLEAFTNWEAAMQFFLQAALEITAAKIDCGLRRDGEFFRRAGFAQRFNHLRLAGDLKPLIRQLAFSNRYWSCWRPERVSVAADVYECAAPAMDLCDESVSEAAERKLCN